MAAIFEGGRESARVPKKQTVGRRTCHVVWFPSPYRRMSRPTARQPLRSVATSILLHTRVLVVHLNGRHGLSYSYGGEVSLCRGVIRWETFSLLPLCSRLRPTLLRICTSTQAPPTAHAGAGLCIQLSLACQRAKPASNRCVSSLGVV